MKQRMLAAVALLSLAAACDDLDDCKELPVRGDASVERHDEEWGRRLSLVGTVVDDRPSEGSESRRVLVLDVDGTERRITYRLSDPAVAIPVRAGEAVHVEADDFEWGVWFVSIRAEDGRLLWAWENGFGKVTIPGVAIRPTAELCLLDDGCGESIRREVEVSIDGATSKARPGDLVRLPGGVVHIEEWRTAGKEEDPRCIDYTPGASNYTFSAVR